MTHHVKDMRAHLVAWATVLLGEQRVSEIMPSLAERAEHLSQLSQAELEAYEEPSVFFLPELGEGGK